MKPLPPPHHTLSLLTLKPGLFTAHGRDASGAIWFDDLGLPANLRDGKVLDAGGAPIPGLFACGNDAASIMQGSYPGPGATLGPAIVFGYRVGRSAAAG